MIPNGKLLMLGIMCSLTLTNLLVDLPVVQVTAGNQAPHEFKQFIQGSKMRRKENSISSWSLNSGKE
jgi:hypothetical protein